MSERDELRVLLRAALVDEDGDRGFTTDLYVSRIIDTLVENREPTMRALGARPSDSGYGRKTVWEIPS